MNEMRNQNDAPRCPRRNSRGLQMSPRVGAINSAEILFILPFVLAILFGIVQYSLWLAAQARYAAASREGARVAAVGGTPAEIETAVKNNLLAGEATVVEIQYDIYSDITLMTPKTTGDYVAVRVTVAACKVVPDLLRFIGYSVCHECIMGQTVLRKE